VKTKLRSADGVLQTLDNPLGISLGLFPLTGSHREQKAGKQKGFEINHVLNFAAIELKSDTLLTICSRMSHSHLNC